MTCTDMTVSQVSQSSSVIDQSTRWGSRWALWRQSTASKMMAWNHSSHQQPCRQQWTPRLNDCPIPLHPTCYSSPCMRTGWHYRRMCTWCCQWRWHSVAASDWLRAYSCIPFVELHINTDIHLKSYNCKFILYFNFRKACFATRKQMHCFFYHCKARCKK